MTLSQPQSVSSLRTLTFYSIIMKGVLLSVLTNTNLRMDKCSDIYTVSEEHKAGLKILGLHNHNNILISCLTFWTSHFFFTFLNSLK